mmetsp:Transcript_25903/g.37159  ORF Transcript_25903/g.37159 Transcript_25903/m.37159 type:complete len:100 (+) Transcript_25903:285-584(+)
MDPSAAEYAEHYTVCHSLESSGTFTCIKPDGSTGYILVYVDDLLLAADTDAELDRIIAWNLLPTTPASSCLKRATSPTSSSATTSPRRRKPAVPAPQRS